jgi:hypothetical protein
LFRITNNNQWEKLVTIKSLWQLLWCHGQVVIW